MSGPEHGAEGTNMEERERGAEAVASRIPELDLSELNRSERNDPNVVDMELAPAELSALEAGLRRVLRPVELPIGFVDRVVARAAAPEAELPKRAKVLPFRSWRLAAGGAIAASLLAGSLVFEEVHQRHAREHAAAMANQQFETATRITEETLERTREQLRRAGVSSIE